MGFPTLNTTPSMKYLYFAAGFVINTGVMGFTLQILSWHLNIDTSYPLLCALSVVAFTFSWGIRSRRIEQSELKEMMYERFQTVLLGLFLTMFWVGLDRLF